MKKFLILLVSLIPVFAQAHGGVSKNAGSTIVYLNQWPLSPEAGERVTFAFGMTDAKLQVIQNLDVELDLVDTFIGDASRDEKILSQNYKTDVNGTFVFEYTFPKDDYYDVELKFTDPVTKQIETTGFLVQVRQSPQIWYNTSMKIFIYVLIAAVLVGGLYLIVRPKPSATPSTNNTQNTVSTKNFNLVIKNRKLVEGPEVISVNEGDNVAITITVDEAEELHLHGYDKSVDLEKNVPATLSFTANLSGRFAYELENSKTDIGALEVAPK